MCIEKLILFVYTWISDDVGTIIHILELTVFYEYSNY